MTTTTGPAGIVVEPMRRRHLRAVLRIDQQAHPRPWTRRLFAAELAAPSGRAYLVARSGRTLVGYGGLMQVVDEGHVTTLAVAEAWRRRGVGSRLLLALAREAIDAGLRSLTLEVRASNRAAQALYRRFGLAPAGVRRDYYPPPPGSGPGDDDGREDAVVMWAEDLGEAGYRARLDAIEAELLGDGARSGGGR